MVGQRSCQYVSPYVLAGRVQWTPEGAHLLLQTRTRVLNDALAALFQEWYRAFPPTAASEASAAA
jgi:hypothetical protein